MTQKPVRVRIAPSPTGEPHVGTAYMALFNLIYARHHNGTFILRIEDTDQSRSRPEYEKSVLNALRWMGITWDEGPDVGGPKGPYRQSERTQYYREYCQKLLDSGHAYKCFATAEELKEMREINAKLGKKIGYDRRYRNLTADEVKQREDAGESYVVRLKMPLKGECTYHDAVKGQIVVPWEDIDDQVLMKSDGFPTYHLANVVDDHLMGITHVIRGDEWMSSTPKHMYLYEALGLEAPTFLHMPLLLGPDGRKLSKRRNPTSIDYFKDTGYLPDALVNFLTLMGYSMPDDQEVYKLDHLIKSFDVKRIGLSGAFFDFRKLDWINQQYIISEIDDEGFLSSLKAWSLNDDFLKKLIPLAKTRIKTFSQFFELCQFFFIEELELTEDLFCVRKLTPKQVCYLLQALTWKLDVIENWTKDALYQASFELSEMFNIHHKKGIIKILFATFTGKHQGPPLFDSFEILGKARARARILKAMEFLGGLSKKDIDILSKHLENQSASELMLSEETINQ